jgi:predicted secreted hydrolase
LEDEKKMKRITLFFALIPFLQLQGEWIQPPEISPKGYLVPSPDYEPSFPKDHGAHRQYGLEWWYWVGHLEAEASGKEFGFQSTVFRLAGDPKESIQPAGSSFGNRQLYLAHSALSDLTEGRYLHTERVMREGWQARADSQTMSFRVAGIKAEISEDGSGHSLITQYPDGGRLELQLTPAKPIIRFGEKGLSRKGDDPASVSWYWSYTRLKATGKLLYEGKEIKVKGEAWMDHEISSSQLGEGLAGWDWTCMHLFDGTEVKAYRLRKDDGGSDRWSAVYWIDRKGNTESVYADRFSWVEQEEWTSPKTGLTYPTHVKIEVDHPQKGKLIYLIEPLIENQEFYGLQEDNAYWEGACRVVDNEGKIIGRAYLELAGYGGGLGARLN